MWHWLEELWRFLTHGRFGYRPQPPPEFETPPSPTCTAHVLQEGVIVAFHQETYNIFSSEMALMRARGMALAKLHNERIFKERELRHEYVNSCPAPCTLEIEWLVEQVVSEGVSGAVPNVTAECAVSRTYRVRCI